MSPFIRLVSNCLVVGLPGVAAANIHDEAQRAFTEFKAVYLDLPSGVCQDMNDTPVRPYRLALEKLREFEHIAQDIPDRPNLWPHRKALEAIVDLGNSPCEDPFAGISFRCDGPCPQTDLVYVEKLDVPRFEVAQPRVEPARVDGYSVVRAEFAGGGWVEKMSNGDWYEFSQQGDRVARFKERGRDEWSVYLYDTTRNLGMQIDLHERMILLNEGAGPKWAQYRISGAAAR